MRTSREQSFEAQDLLELALAGAVDLSSLEHDELVELACLALERLTGARRPWKAPASVDEAIALILQFPELLSEAEREFLTSIARRPWAESWLTPGEDTLLTLLLAKCELACRGVS